MGGGVREADEVLRLALEMGLLVSSFSRSELDLERAIMCLLGEGDGG